MNHLHPVPREAWEPIVRAALEEDLGDAGDLTSQTTLAPDATAAGRIVARAAGVIAGLDIALSTFHLLSEVASGPVPDAARALSIQPLDPKSRRLPSIEIEPLVGDGAEVAPGTPVARIAGPVRLLLGAERTALNLLGHLSGIATATRELVRRVEGTGARIIDTRKTTPGLRALEKYAVRCGGGFNHRSGLYDAVLIKDNHVAAVGSVGEAVRRARAGVAPTVQVQVEVDDLEQLEEALAAGAEIVLLDNMPPAVLREAVARTAGRALLEASGGITPEAVREVAETGVDRISVGWITHSAPALDVALDLTTPRAASR